MPPTTLNSEEPKKSFWSNIIHTAYCAAALFRICLSYGAGSGDTVTVVTHIMWHVNIDPESNCQDDYDAN